MCKKKNFRHLLKLKKVEFCKSVELKQKLWSLPKMKLSDGSSKFFYIKYKASLNYSLIQWRSDSQNKVTFQMSAIFAS